MLYMFVCHVILFPGRGIFSCRFNFLFSYFFILFLSFLFLFPLSSHSFFFFFLPCLLYVFYYCWSGSFALSSWFSLWSPKIIGRQLCVCKKTAFSLSSFFFSQISIHSFLQSCRCNLASFLELPYLFKFLASLFYFPCFPCVPDFLLVSPKCLLASFSSFKFFISWFYFPCFSCAFGFVFILLVLSLFSCVPVQWSEKLHTLHW